MGVSSRIMFDALISAAGGYISRPASNHNERGNELLSLWSGRIGKLVRVRS